MTDCGCDGAAGRCTFPNCLPEEDQQALANEVFDQLYGGTMDSHDPKITPIRHEREPLDYDGGIAPSDTLVDVAIILGIFTLFLFVVV